MGGFIYQNDILQFVSHEEGRARWALHRYVNGSSKYGWEYDYFIKDHLGNTRMVLTQEKDTAQYIATMEAAYRATENQLFYNIPPSSYARSAVSGYLSDPTTNPNDSLIRVNGNGPKTGPSTWKEKLITRSGHSRETLLKEGVEFNQLGWLKN